MEKERECEVAIVGGGITGTALLYMLSRYSSVRKIILLEKNRRFAEINSSSENNSQTLHFGDIETNYSFEKAKIVKEAAEMVVSYVKGRNRDLFRVTHKMVLAVGQEEVAELRDRYERFKALFPNLRLLGRKEIELLEPRVVAGREPGEEILALCSEDGYAVNFQKLSESFVLDSLKEEKEVEFLLSARVKEIRREKDFYLLVADEGLVRARAVAVAAGPHGLIFAQSLGYGTKSGILPISGGFYRAENVLRGKVYTMQVDKLPFAAIHGDPDVVDPRETRFGPTAKVLPLLERGSYRTFFDFLRTSAFTLDGVWSLLKIVSDWVILKYVIKNLAYDLPILGKWFFLRDARKIVPLLKYADLSYLRGVGGIRPQVVDTRTKKMEMGSAKIIGDKAIFNITPSPGASVCLKNAEEDAKMLVGFLGEGHRFKEDKFKEDFLAKINS